MKTYKTALVLIPPEDVWEPIQQIRRRYDDRISRWMPHITLLYPFWPREKFPEVCEQLQPLCEGFTPLQISLEKFGYFAKRRQQYVVWLEPQPGNVLKQLLSSVLMVDPERKSKTFTPHLTVGRIQGREQLDKILGELRDHWQSLHFTIDSVHLIWREDPPDDVFTIGETVTLGQN